MSPTVAEGDHTVFEREDYPDFVEHIVYGIRLHDDAMELLGQKRAQQTCEEYGRLYGGPDKSVFTVHYYGKTARSRW